MCDAGEVFRPLLFLVHPRRGHKLLDVALHQLPLSRRDLLSRIFYSGYPMHQGVRIDARQPPLLLCAIVTFDCFGVVGTKRRQGRVWVCKARNGLSRCLSTGREIVFHPKMTRFWCVLMPAYCIPRLQPLFLWRSSLGPCVLDGVGCAATAACQKKVYFVRLLCMRRVLRTTKFLAVVLEVRRSMRSVAA